MTSLFDPITVGAPERSLTIRNRVWIPPMCQYYVFANDGVPTDWHVMHLGQFAAGGAGLVIAEASAVLPEGRITPRDTGMWNDEQAKKWKGIVRLIKSQGAAAGIQLAHAGRKASIYDLSGQDVPEGLVESDPSDPDNEHIRWWTGGRGSVPFNEGGWQTYGPADVTYGRYTPPLAMTVEQIEEVIAAFGRAARRAQDAGFDVVEIHGAHGYLIHQFLSPLVNTRMDEWGGPTLENRSRLLLSVVKEVRKSAPDVALFLRLSGTDWAEEGGWDLEETSIVAQQAADLGVDLIDVSSGGAVLGVKIPVGPGYQVPLAAHVRKEVSVPVSAVGLITEAVQAQQLVQTGQVDAVMVGREALRNPHIAFQMADKLGYRLPYVPGPYCMSYSAQKDLYKVSA